MLSNDLKLKILKTGSFDENLESKSESRIFFPSKRNFDNISEILGTNLGPCQISTMNALAKRLPLHKKWSFPLRISSVNVETADLVTFTEEILNGKLYFLCTLHR